MTKQVMIRLDGEYVRANEGETVLDVARANGKFIPTLCHLDGLSSLGGCRLCLVEVSGSSRLLPSCSTIAADGMVVLTNTERLKKYRKMILELVFSERNHVCSVCVSNGHCELQALATALGMTHVSFPYRYPSLEVDMSHPRFVIDHNRCILCGRCVRTCDEIEGAHTWDIISRGINSMVTSDLKTPWGVSDSCTSCGKCVQMCPTGALVEKGQSVGEMTKRQERISNLVRGGNQ